MPAIDTELGQFLLSLCLGLAIGGSIVIPVFVSRWRRGEKLIQPSRPNPTWTWPLGIFTFGLLTLTSFAGDRPIFGTTFTVVLIPYVIGLIRSLRTKAKQEGEQGGDGDAEEAV